MDILYLLIPLSAGLVLLILGLFGWALQRGQFDDVEREGQRILQDETSELDSDQGAAPLQAEQSMASNSGFR